jgi:hypothetical protein
MYFSTIQQIFNNFNFTYNNEFIYNENLIIEYLEENYENYSTLKGLDQYLISSKQGKPYSTSSSFSKAFKKQFNDFNVYDLRKAITSETLRRNNPDEIKNFNIFKATNYKLNLQTITYTQIYKLFK